MFHQHPPSWEGSLGKAAQLSLSMLASPFWQLVAFTQLHRWYHLHLHGQPCPD